MWMAAPSKKQSKGGKRAMIRQIWTRIKKEPEQNFPESHGKQGPREGADQLLNEDIYRGDFRKREQKSL